LTGTFSGSIRNYYNSRAYSFTYTINSANTWQYVTITIPGDTGGTWVSGGTGGYCYVNFNIGNGSTYLAPSAGSWQSGNYQGVQGTTSILSTNSATLYFTGIQLEKGAAATPFEYRHYGTELALCQRYYQTYTNLPIPFGANGNNGLNGWLSLVYPVVMRTAPSAAGSSASYKQNASSITITSITSISTNAGFLDQLFANAASNPGYSLPTIVYFGTLALSAEL
jgi:hypothetical protein